MNVTCTNDGIQFSRYPFAPASVAAKGFLPLASVRDADPGAAPPEVRTLAGETLFVSATQADELREWLASVRVPTVVRTDVWALVLEPFLDLEFSPADEEATIATLEALGVAREETLAWRSTVGPAMLAYNAILWDWTHLGLHDLLTAVRQGTTRLALIHRFSRRRFAAFYWRAMEFAERGRAGSASPG